MLQNLLNKYISFINKKPFNNILKWLMFAWVVFLSFLYYYYDNKVYIWFIFCIISLLAYFTLKKIVIKIININFFQKRFILKLKHLLSALPLFACLIANLFLFTSSQNTYFKIFPLNDFLFYELNIFQKIFSSYLFYLLMTFLVYALGRKILKIAGFNFDSGLEKFVFSVGTGFIPFMFAIYFIALAGWLYAWVIWLIIAIFFIFSLSETKKIISETEKTDMDISFNSSWKIYKNIIIFILLVIFASMVAANFKPVATDGDDLHTYYNAPYLYVSYHQFKPLRHFEGSNMGQNTEMIYAGIMSILEPRYIMHFSLFSFLLIALGVYLMFKKIFGDRFATLSLLTISLVPWNSYLLTTVKVDFFLSFYLLLQIYLFYLWKNNNFQNKYLYLIGVFAGISVGIKYNAFFIIIPLYSAVLTVIIINKKPLLKYLKPLFISAILAIIMFSPWGIKNQIYFNNILYPFEFFQKNTKNLNDFNYNQIATMERGKEMLYLRFVYFDEKSLTNFLETIWNKSFHKGKAMSIFNDLGFIPLLIIPFYFLLLKNKKILVLLFMAILSILIWYMVAEGRIWYIYFTILLLCAILPYLLWQNKILFFFFLTFASLNFMAFMPYNSGANNNYLIGAYNNELYKFSIPYFQTMNYINGLNLKNNEKILATSGFGVVFIERNDQLTIMDPFLLKSGPAIERGDIYFKKILNDASIRYIYDAGRTNLEMCSNIFPTTESQVEYSLKFKRKTPLICEDLINLKKFLINNAELIYNNKDNKLYKIKNISL